MEDGARPPGDPQSDDSEPSGPSAPRWPPSSPPETDPTVGEPGPPPEVFVRFGLVFYGLLAAAAVVWRVGWQGGAMWTAGSAADPLFGNPAVFTRDLGIGVVTGLGLLGLSEVATRRTAWGDRLARSMAQTLGPLSVPNALLLATASGLAEELFFRGALQPMVGWLWASLLFGSVHFVPRREFVPWTVFAIGAGLLFGWLYDWTGSLTAPVVAHTLVNGVNLPRLVREYGAGALSERER